MNFSQSNIFKNRATMTEIEYAKLKKQFDKLSYSDKLKFWEENKFSVGRTFPFQTHYPFQHYNDIKLPEEENEFRKRRTEYEKKKISIYPETDEEKEIGLKWFIDYHSKRLKGKPMFNIDLRKKEFFKTFKETNSNAGRESFVTAQLDLIQKNIKEEKDFLGFPLKERQGKHITGGIEVGYESEKSKQPIGFSEFEKCFIERIIEGKTLAKYEFFLKDLLHKLKSDVSINELDEIANEEVSENGKIPSIFYFETSKKEKENFFKKIKKYKPDFEKLSFSDQLNYWEINCDPLIQGYFEDVNGKEKIIISLQPKGDEETEMYNLFYLKHYVETVRFLNAESLKFNFLKDFENSKNKKKLIESEIGKLERKKNNLTGENTNVKLAMQTVYKPIFDDYELRGKEPNWKKVDIEVVQHFAQVKCIVDYKLYLEESLKQFEIDDLINEPKEKLKNRKLPKKTDYFETILTQNQTKLLMHYLRKKKFILPNTSNTFLCECFGKLTGYAEIQLEKDFKGVEHAYQLKGSKNDFDSLLTELNSLVSLIEKEKNEFIKENLIK